MKAVTMTAAAAIGLAGGLYLALGSGESPANTTLSELAPLRQGDMAKLNFAAAPGSNTAFTSEHGGDMTLAAFEGK